MVFSRFSKKKWQHNDPEIRLAAVKELGVDALQILKDIALNDTDERVRLEAVMHIQDDAILESIVQDSTDDATRQLARSGIEKIFYHRLLATSDEQEWPQLLQAVSDIKLLATLAVEAGPPQLRVLAVNKIEDPEVLCSILEHECGKLPAMAALAKLTSTSHLKRVTECAASKKTQALAAQKLAAITGPPSLAEIDDKASQHALLDNIAETAEKLAGSQSWELVRDRFTELARTWDELDPHGSHPGKAAFEQARHLFALRYNTEKEKRDTASRIEEVFENCETLCSAVETAAQHPDDNASELVQSAKSKWPPLDDNSTRQCRELAMRFSEACARFDMARTMYLAEKEQESQAKEMLRKVESTLASDFDQAGVVLKELDAILNAARFKFITPSALRKEKQTLLERWQALAQEKTAQERKKNIETREKLCAELETLVDLKNQTKALQKESRIKENWQALPPLDGLEGEALVKRFAELELRFQEHINTALKEQEWERWANKTKKEELLALVEALDAETDLQAVASAIRTAQQKWKKIGPVPQEDSETLWQSFREACDRNYERCRIYFEELDRQRKGNQQAKEQLIARAEEISNSGDWKQAADDINVLREQWETTGPALRENEGELNRRFRSVCNSFFERRRKHFAELDAQRQENLAAKESICQRAEALLEEPHFSKSKKIRALQEEWKDVGPGERAGEQKLWQRFRAACDAFYGALEELRQENLKKKQELCRAVEELVSAHAEDATPQETAEKIRALQNDWKEIGPTPRDESDAVWERFKTACDGFFALQREKKTERDKELNENLEKKLAIIAQAEEVGNPPPNPESTQKLQELQELWKEIGPAPRKKERDLWRRFSDICDGYFQERRQHFEDIAAEQDENLQKKETLCCQLEQLGGGATQSYTTLSLADEFRIAREMNFLLGGERDNKQRVLDEVRRIQAEWKTIGQVPRQHAKALQQRYRSLLDRFYQDSRPQKPASGN